jgi:hypothetical protein
MNTKETQLVMKNNLSMVDMLKELYPHFEGTNVFILESTGFLNEISLNPDNAVEIKGNVNKGEFQVGNIVYSYNAVKLPEGKPLPNSNSNFVNDSKTYDINFHVKGEDSSDNKKGKENLIKIYSTMFKVILDFISSVSPNYLLISAFDSTGYFPIYSQLTKTNKIPGYSRKTIVNWIYPGKGDITSIVLKKNGK